MKMKRLRFNRAERGERELRMMIVEGMVEKI
jgi:hypothetical protein